MKNCTFEDQLQAHRLAFGEMLEAQFGTFHGHAVVGTYLHVLVLVQRAIACK